MQLFIHTGATDLSAAAVTSATDLTPLADLPDVVLGDSEPLTLKFLSAISAYEAWTIAAGYTFTIALGYPSADGSLVYEISSNFADTTNGVVGHLPLSSTELANAFASAANRRGCSVRGQAASGFTLQVRVADPDGNPETYAELDLTVRGTVAPVPAGDDTAANYATYANMLASQAAAAASATASASSATASASSATSSGTSATAAATFATNAAGSATSAATSAATATTQASNASTQATNAANSATASGVSATASAASATAAATSATNSANSATAAATSATQATANGAAQVTLAAAQVTLATTQATNAATSASAAATSATNAGTSATNAATSATAAATSATAAASSASSAASSATSAINAIASGFLGGVAGASVPATATTAGNYYRITSAGTSQSKTWATGDIAIYNGTSGSWTQIAGNITDPASLANKTNALSPRGGVAIDGSGNARVYSQLTGQTFGTDALSVTMGFRCPTSNPSANHGLFFLSGSNTTIVSANAFGARVTTSGTLEVKLFNAGANGSYDTIVNNFVSTYGGKVVYIAVVRNGAALTVYINGTLATGTAAGFGTSPPTDYSGTIASTYFNIGFNAPAEVAVGALFCSVIYNLALTGADVTEICELGGAVPERYKFGSQVGVNTSAFTQSSGGGGLITLTSNSGTGVNCVTSGTFTFALIRPGPAPFTQKRLAGNKYRIKATLTINSGPAPTVNMTTDGNGVSSEGSSTLVAGANTFEKTIAANGSGNTYSEFGLATGMDFVLSAVSVTALGAVVHLPLDDGLGYQLQDVSTNRLHALMSTTGATHVAPLYGPGRIRGTTSTSGNQQLCAGTVLPATSQILRIRARTQSGTPTVTLGTSSGGSQVVASVALSTTWKVLTIALTDGYVAAASSLWVGSSNTSVIEWDITWEPLSA